MRRLNLALLLVLAGPAGAIHAGTAFHDPIYGVAKTSDIVYGTGAINNGAGTLNLLLDLYRPTDIGGGALPALSPGVVIIHGGAFTSGSKTDLAPFAQIFASYGYTVASINYRLLGHNVPETHGPADAMMPPPPPFLTLPIPQGAYTVNAAIEDATKAMQWMRASAATYNIDPDRIGIGGGSAGAITALLQAYNNPPPDAAPQVVLSFLGAMYGTENTIQPGAAPAFAVASSNDTVVPFAAPLGTQAFVDRMNAVGVYNEFYVQSINHNVDFFADFGGQTLLGHNLDFLVQFLVPEPSSFALCALAGVALFAAARAR
jgi:acetyl esterase/lipase